MSSKRATPPRSLKGIRNAAQRKKIDERLVVMGRFLAGLKIAGAKCVLKGGLAIQLRTERKRSTKDVDLIASGHPDDFLAVLEAAATADRGDPIYFSVKPDPRRPELPAHPDIKHGGRRYHVVADDGAGNNALTFSVEVVFGPLPSSELIVSRVLDPLWFPPVEVLAVPVLDQLADKIWLCCEASRDPAGLATRYRDLADVYLLSTDADGLVSDDLCEAVADEFGSRSSTNRENRPARLPDPPSPWLTDKKIIATLCRFTGLHDIDELLAQVRDFVDPVLQMSVSRHVWDTESHGWMPLSDFR